MKKMWSVWVVAVACLAQLSVFADSVSLFNDSQYTLRAVVAAADGTVLGEFVMNSRDGAQWSSDYMNLGNDIPGANMVPYVITWYCMRGNVFGVCDNVAPGTLVAAESCGGTNECSDASPQE